MADNELYKACLDGNVEKARRLLVGGADPTFHKDLAIREASQLGRSDIVELLLKDGRADPAACGNWAIQSAAIYNRPSILKLLLDSGRVNPNDGKTLGFAATLGNLDVLNILLDDGRADPAAENNQAITSAARNGRITAVKRLLQDNRVGIPKRALCEAVLNGHEEVLLTLLNDSRIVAGNVEVEDMEWLAKDNQAMLEAIRKWREEVNV